MIFTDAERQRAKELEARTIRLEEAFRKTVASEEGREVLGWIFNRCRVGECLDASPETVALHNLGVALLGMIRQADPHAAKNILWDHVCGK